VMEQQENTVRIPVVKVNKPCEECGSTNYPNLQYTLMNIQGVLCQKCLNAEMERVNEVLKSMGES